MKEKDAGAAAPLEASTDAAAPAAGADSDTGAADQGNSATGAVASAKNLLNDHKGKLAVGVAATLGLMVFYKWREKKLAQEDPEAYASLQRVKDGVRAGEVKSRQRNEDGKNTVGDDAVSPSSTQASTSPGQRPE